MVADVAPTEPVLTRGVVTLRPFRLSDAGRVAESCQDSDIPRFTMMPDDLTEPQARQWVERRNALQDRGLFAFAITVDQSDDCIGQMGIFIDTEHRRAETFYWLDRAHRGRGIVTNALDLVTEWAFAEHDVQRAHLITHLENEASMRVAERAGYQREGVLRAWEPIKGSQPDVVMFSRLPHDPVPPTTEEVHGRECS